MTFLAGQLLRAADLNDAIAQGGIVRTVAGRTGSVILAVEDVAGAAALVSPLFTGEPRGPTASPDTNTTQLATTAYVIGQASDANPVMDGTAAPGVGLRLSRADHVHPSDTSRVAKVGDAMAGALLIVAGTLAAPGLGISGETNTGLHAPSAGQLALVVTGTARLTASASGLTPTVPILMPAGAVGTPSLSFGSETNTGIYRPGASQIAVAVAGAQRLNLAAQDHTLTGRRLVFTEETPGNGVDLRLTQAGAANAIVSFHRGSEARWWFYLADPSADLDAGSSAGSNLAIRRWSDAAASLGDMVVFRRDNGDTRFMTVGSVTNPTIRFSDSSHGINYDGSQVQFVYNGAARGHYTASLFSLGVPFAINHSDAAGNNIAQAGTGVALRITNTGTGDSFLVEDAASTDSTPFVVKNDGKVGIGLTAPTVELDVVGQIKASSTVTGATPTLDEHLATKLYVDTLFGTVGGFPAGTRMTFQQTAAPPGWTKELTHDNKAMRLVTGTVGTGGTVNFTTAFASKAVTGTVDNTTLTTGQIPVHAHANTPSGGNIAYANNATLFLYPLTTGSGNYIGFGPLSSTSNAGSGGAHNHGFTGTAIDMAVQYVDFIIASKD